MKRYIPPKMLAPVTKSTFLLCTLIPKDMAMFRFLLEGYDGLALFTVIEPQSALIKLIYSPHEKQRLQNALIAIQECIPLQCMEYPFNA